MSCVVCVHTCVHVGHNYVHVKPLDSIITYYIEYSQIADYSVSFVMIVCDDYVLIYCECIIIHLCS